MPRTPQSIPVIPMPIRKNPHEGEVDQVNGYWLCWKHHQQFNTDGVRIKGQIRTSEEGDNPWYNQI